MSLTLPVSIQSALKRADRSWQTVLLQGLEALQAANPGYLDELAADDYLPTEDRIFAAFTQPLSAVRYVLVGEGPYPRAESATGVCFMDGAVGSLWSEAGLSKQVNRATSLRNFIKMLLVADGRLSETDTGGTALAPISGVARAPGSPYIQTLAELQANLIARGFLLLNAALVFRPHVPPLKEAKAWRPFLETVLTALADRNPPPALILWGKIAEQLQVLPDLARFPQVVSEHPYNLSFIRHAGMQELFGGMHLLNK